MNKIFKLVNISYLILSILLIGLFSGCSNKDIESSKDVITVTQKTNFSNIDQEEAKKRLDREKGIILLDVRTKEEYETGHIKGSILLPLDNLEEEAVNKFKDKKSPIFVYCRSGNRSVRAANILIEQGYENVYNMGGINDWPYGIVKK